jgi:hypothetical protein
MWPEIKILHEKSSQSIQMRPNADIKYFLKNWMRENQTLNWPLGLMFVQMLKNNTYNPLIECTPFFAAFGVEMNAPISYKMFQNIVSYNVSSENELRKVLFCHFYALKFLIFKYFYLKLRQRFIRQTLLI